MHRLRARSFYGLSTLALPSATAFSTTSKRHLWSRDIFFLTAAKRRSAVWRTALKDEADQKAAAGEGEKMVEAAGCPPRISSGDVRLVAPLFNLLLLVVPMRLRRFL